MKKMLYIAALATLSACTKEDITIVEVTEVKTEIVAEVVTEVKTEVVAEVETEIEVSFYNDVIYSKLSTPDATPQDYLDAFVLDGLRHDRVIDTIGFRFTPYDNGGVWPQATGNVNACNPAASGVNIEVNWWALHDETFETEINNTVHRKLAVMWHEFGHSLLNMDHTCETGQIMTGINEAKGCFEPPRPDLWTLELNNLTDGYNFQVAAANLFKETNANYFTCN